MSTMSRDEGAQAAAADLGPLIDEVVRKVTDVDTIKALADPTRLAILRVMNREGRARSAKELAEKLSEPQTKLYRHLKVLQEAGLIEVAETRVVSGIVETRYRAAQRSVHIDPSGNLDETGDDVLRIIAIDLDAYRDRFLAYARTDEFREEKRDLRSRGAVFGLSATIPAEKVTEFQERMSALMDEFDTYPRVAEGIEFEAMISWFTKKGSEDPEPE